MGSFVNNLHVRADDEQTVLAALGSLLTAPAYYSPLANGWVSVFPSQDSHSLARDLSAQLKTAVLAFDTYDGAVLYYELYEQGMLTDEFNSDPDHFVGQPDENGDLVPPATEAEKTRLRGNPERLLPYCVAGTSVADVNSALGSVFREGWRPAEGPETVLVQIAQLLGIPERQALSSFRYVELDRQYGDLDLEARPVTPAQ